MSLPDEIGPHEGIEFELMKKGKKNLALFIDYEPPELQDFLSDEFKLLKFAQTTSDGVSYITRIVFRHGYDIQAARLQILLKLKINGISPRREHEIGKLLSYTPEQVNAFIAQFSSDL